MWLYEPVLALPSLLCGPLAQPLGRLDQRLATLPGLGDSLRQTIPRPLSDPVLGGPQPIDLPLAEEIRALAGPVGGGAFIDDGPNSSERRRQRQPTRIGGPMSSVSATVHISHAKYLN